MNRGRSVLAAVLAAVLAVPCGLALAAAGPAAFAQAWPVKPIGIVVTYAPGGGADAMARLLAPKLSQELGQPVTVENKPGGSGQIGASQVAKSPPDGYTLMLDASSYAVNPALFPKLSYDTEKAFRPIGIVALFPNVILVTPAFPARTLDELIAAAKTTRDGVSYASSGNGSAQHLAGALFGSITHVEMLHMPYKGGGPALKDVLSGQVPVLFGNIASTLPYIQDGKLRALALTGSRRSALLPGVPTAAEAGVKGYEVYEWNVLAAPAHTPDAVVRRISDALRKALASPEIKARIQALGGEIVGGTPEAAQQFVRQQAATWSRVIRERKITVE